MFDLMSEAGEPVKFSQRLHGLLEQSGMSQAKLAERAGVERSTISRLIKGDRTPGMETLQLLAPVFNMDVAQLVQGTDAAAKLTDSAAMIRRQDYDAAVQQMMKYEEQVHDLQRQLHAAQEALLKGQSDRSRAGTELCAMQFNLEVAQRDLQLERQRSADQGQELKQYRTALQRAVADVSSLRGQLEDLAQELKDTAKSSRTTAILAGVAALAGVVTAATYLATNDSRRLTSQEEPR